jgi:hypothetical protein
LSFSENPIENKRKTDPNRFFAYFYFHLNLALITSMTFRPKGPSSPSPHTNIDGNPLDSTLGSYHGEI